MTDEDEQVHHSAYWGSNWAEPGAADEQGRPKLNVVGRFNRAQATIGGIILLGAGIVFIVLGIAVDLRSGVVGTLLLGILFFVLGVVSLILRATRWKGYAK